MYRLIRQAIWLGLLSYPLWGCARSDPYKDEIVVIRPMRLYDISQVDVRPKVLSQVKPVYPFDLRRNGYEGEALIGVFVSADGSVSDPVILRATDIRFGDSARQASLKWRYRPAEINHHPVACALAVRVKFEFRPDEDVQITMSDGLSLDEMKKDSPKPPLQTPSSGTPAAGAPVVPPSGAAGR
jgi:protein TonB